MNRRNFLKNGGLAVMGLMAAPQLFTFCTSAGGPSGAEGVAFALEHFGVTQSQLKKVLAAALEKGGDYADLFFEHTFDNSISLLDGAVNSSSSSIDFGMGVRVIAGDRTGYAFIEDITPEEMLKAAKTAARIASGGEAGRVADLIEKPVVKSFYAIKTPWEEANLQLKMPYLLKLDELVRGADSRITKVTAWLNDTTSHILFCNSEGVIYYDYRPMSAIGGNCVIESEGKTESGSANRSFRQGSEFLSDELMAELAGEMSSQADVMLRAVKPKGGEMPVVMAAGGSGILLHEAIGHAFEADFNRKNTSIFADKLGKQVCDASISVIDDATVPANRGSLNIDDEGNEGQKTYIVRDGVLTSYLHDRISSRYYGVSPTGNGRRESFRHMPIPRMRATYMEAGTATEEEIIAQVKHGVFVEKFTNGQVQIGAGDFTFYVKQGRLIENGRLTDPIKDINIIGNGPQALADITLVANNPIIDNGTWTCGKNGQSCPVTCGMPSALVSKLTVGGEA